MKYTCVLALLACLLYAAATNGQNFPEMVKVEGGTFLMGDADLEGEGNEQPTHEVTLKTFFIAKTETTVAQWRTFCAATGRKMPEAPEWGWNDSHPIVNVSWHEAVEYCDWLSDRTGQLYRLPTEAEWEYAARGGNQGKGFKYSGGQSIDAVGWFVSNSGGQTRPVAQKRPNELGLYDMSGNVWEWCRDWYGENYYASSPKDNPRGPGSGSYRVLRGGSWRLTAAYCRVANRGNYSPGYRNSSYGFRVVMSQ